MFSFKAKVIKLIDTVIPHTINKKIPCDIIDKYMCFTLSNMFCFIFDECFFPTKILTGKIAKPLEVLLLPTRFMLRISRTTNINCERKINSIITAA